MGPALPEAAWPCDREDLSRGEDLCSRGEDLELCEDLWWRQPFFVRKSWPASMCKRILRGSLEHQNGPENTGHVRQENEHADNST